MPTPEVTGAALGDRVVPRHQPGFALGEVWGSVGEPLRPCSTGALSAAPSKRNCEVKDGGVTMNNEILAYYFTDAQMAVIEGITLGGLRNKIYRGNAHSDGSASPADQLPVADLPEHINVNPRTRLWSKEKVRAHLMVKFCNDAKVVDELMQKGESTPPGGSFKPRRARKEAQ